MIKLKLNSPSAKDSISAFCSTDSSSVANIIESSFGMNGEVKHPSFSFELFDSSCSAVKYRSSIFDSSFSLQNGRDMRTRTLERLKNIASVTEMKSTNAPREWVPILLAMEK